MLDQVVLTPAPWEWFAMVFTGFSKISLSLFFKYFYFILRERQSVSGEGAERDAQNPKQTPGSEPDAG